MQHQNQAESGEIITAVLLNKEIVLPTTVTRVSLLDQSAGIDMPAGRIQSVRNSLTS